MKGQVWWLGVYRAMTLATTVHPMSSASESGVEPETDEVRLARIRAFAHPVRIRILEMLRLDIDHTLRMSQLRAGIPVRARASLVHHLRQLEENRMIERVQADAKEPDPRFAGLRFTPSWTEEDLQKPGWEAIVLSLDAELNDRRIGRIRAWEEQKKAQIPRSPWTEPEFNMDGALVLTQAEAAWLKEQIQETMEVLSSRARERRRSGMTHDQQTMFVTMLCFPLLEDEQ